MTLSSLDGADAVVTGASHGLGYTFARSLAEAGARVWMVAEVADELHDAVREIVAGGGRVEFRVVDLSALSAITELVIDIRSKAPRLEVLVNDAVFLKRAARTDTDRSVEDSALAASTVPMVLCQGLLPGLLRGGGSIINLSSGTGREPFTQLLAGDLSGTSISVNSVEDALHPEGDHGEDALDLAPAVRFVSSLRGQPSGAHLDLHEMTRTLEAHGAEYLLRALSKPDDEVNK